MRGREGLVKGLIGLSLCLSAQWVVFVHLQFLLVLSLGRVRAGGL